jgi:hypothetical protein
MSAALYGIGCSGSESNGIMLRQYFVLVGWLVPTPSDKRGIMHTTRQIRATWRSYEHYPPTTTGNIPSCCQS